MRVYRLVHGALVVTHTVSTARLPTPSVTMLVLVVRGTAEQEGVTPYTGQKPLPVDT